MATGSKALEDIIGIVPLTEALRATTSGIPDPFPPEFSVVKPANRVLGDRARRCRPLIPLRHGSGAHERPGRHDDAARVDSLAEADSRADGVSCHLVDCVVEDRPGVKLRCLDVPDAEPAVVVLADLIYAADHFDLLLRFRSQLLLFRHVAPFGGLFAAKVASYHEQSPPGGAELE